MRFSPYERLKQSAAGESVAMQTDATSHNIFTPTMLGVVGTCCVVHANERNNCQPCWRFSKEAMHSGTVILKNDCNAHAQTFSRGRHCWRNIEALRFAGHRTMEMLGLVAPKFDRFQTIRNTATTHAVLSQKGFAIEVSC